MSAPIAIAHIGPGAFHRAHQALYVQALRDMGLAGTGAGIRAICLFEPRIGAALAAQGGAYHVLLREGAQAELCRVDAIREVLDHPQPQMLSDPGLALVTMTLTEKGYCHLPGTRRLDPEVIAPDLADPLAPRSAIGWLGLALEMRRRAGAGPITLASCDNIPDNGRLLESVLSAYVAQAWPDLAPWMAQNVAFPVSMVDRIVPRVDDQALAAVAGALAAQGEDGGDPMGIAAEPFCQWVLERRLAAPIPPLELAGVQIVEDVAPYERMKHRILNGAQTALAHLGALSGFATSAEAAADPVLGLWLEQFIAAQAETLEVPPGEDLAAYGRATMARLRNPHIRHPLEQIGTDSSFKLGQRVLEGAAMQLDRPARAPLYVLTIAAWIRYNLGQDARGRPIAISDPLAGRFAQIKAQAAGDPAALVEGFLALEMFAGRLREDGAFRAQLVACVAALAEQSPRDWIALGPPARAGLSQEVRAQDVRVQEVRAGAPGRAGAGEEETW